MKRLGFLSSFGAAVIAASLYPVDFVLRYVGRLQTKEGVHQIIEDIFHPYIFQPFGSSLPSSLAEEMEQALSPLDCRVVVDSTIPLLDSPKVQIFYRLPTDKPATFRHAQIGIELETITLPTEV